ncbi:decarboxylating 6-phosphogluconate dehydrogenase [Dyella sp. M7H15-1]|uniref:phosphogluconate dehydrogenase (NAD(+)-dependent, decarboxylating) n=1 Tax=Dyella sp. M7H15-1 TaxID=2501295 RepID=UPI00100510FD|nr:decarboxylating 6-phosphogluconate dehydrogenase [Dyella sp. M7H15-1]QAU24497.1 decarboxylating 6-phosphogluconate dehydrogenase [Dyella sp. M7H15-1]
MSAATSRKETLQLGFVGLGRMGLNMVRRMQQAGIDCVVFDTNIDARKEAASYGSTIAESIQDLAGKLEGSRAVWLMLPTAVVDAVLDQLVPLLSAGDIVIDGGNSHYVEDLRRAEALSKHRIMYVDVGVSGGVWGCERGYCQMIGGPEQAYKRLEPAFVALAPGVGAAPRSEGRTGDPSPAENGYLYCGPSGAGHFVKMIHNGIEYGLMTAYAEGLNVLKGANAGKHKRSADAETSPLEHPERYQYDFPISEITELWRRGSVIGSWLLDLTATELNRDPSLKDYTGRVSDSGEGRWTAQAAIDEGVPVPVLTAALFGRFTSQGNELYANKVMSAMRHAFGGHHEVTTDNKD